MINQYEVGYVVESTAHAGYLLKILAKNPDGSYRAEVLVDLRNRKSLRPVGYIFNSRKALSLKPFEGLNR